MNICISQQPYVCVVYSFLLALHRTHCFFLTLDTYNGGKIVSDLSYKRTENKAS